MDIQSPRGIHPAYQLILAAVCLLGLLSLGVAGVRADGGGFPTATPRPPTATFAPTITSTTTLVPVLILNTATSTPAEGGASNLSIQMPTAIPVEPQRSPVSLTYCWPFAIVVLAVLIIGIWWLRNRLAQNAYESME